MLGTRVSSHITSPSFSRGTSQRLSPPYLLSESHITPSGHSAFVMDSVPPAASPHATSVVTATASGASMGSVFVKHAGDARANFAKVPILVGDAVTDLAERASLKLDWRTSAAYVELFLVKPGGEDEPSAAEEEEALKQPRLGVGRSLSRAGIVSGAWVIARLTDPSAAAPGECVRETVKLLSCSSWRPDGSWGRSRDSTVARGATLVSPSSHPIAGEGGGSNAGSGA